MLDTLVLSFRAVAGGLVCAKFFELCEYLPRVKLEGVQVSSSVFYRSPSNCSFSYEGPYYHHPSTAPVRTSNQLLSPIPIPAWVSLAKPTTTKGNRLVLVLVPP